MQLDRDAVSELFSDLSLNSLLHGQHVPPIAQRHERASERHAVDRALDLDKTACAEKGR
jgi:hypothetical protein